MSLSSIGGSTFSFSQIFNTVSKVFSSFVSSIPSILKYFYASIVLDQSGDFQGPSFCHSSQKSPVPAFWFSLKNFDVLSNFNRYIVIDSRFKVQEVFIVNLYRSLHKMFDIMFSTNTTKGGWNHIWLIYPLFHYYNFPNVLWALRTVVSKNNRQTKQIHRFSTLIVDYKFVSKTFYEWTWFVDREMVVSKCSVRISLIFR